MQNSKYPPPHNLFFFISLSILYCISLLFAKNASTLSSCCASSTPLHTSSMSHSSSFRSKCEYLLCTIRTCSSATSL